MASVLVLEVKFVSAKARRFLSAEHLALFLDSHVELFPKSVSDILRAHSVDELHVHLTQGVFRHQRWGYPLLSAPSGGEVWAWFKEDVR